MAAGRLAMDFLDRVVLVYSERDNHNKQIGCINRNPRCENNLGDVDKYRYSVALVELGFGTDAIHPIELV